jgi:hypothetical protein
MKEKIEALAYTLHGTKISGIKETSYLDALF